MRYYIGLIHRDPGSDFGISFPDFPGCVSAGSTLQEAMDMGKEALAAHIAFLADDDDPIPEPSDMDGVMADPENRDGVAVLVPAPEPAERVIRVNVTLPEGLLRRIDAVADNRSGFLAKAAEKALESA